MRTIVILASSVLSSCSFFEKEEAVADPAASRPALVGRIAAIPAAGDFVLIESYGTWRVPEGGLLSGIGRVGTSSLVATGEQLGQHAAADIRSGSVNIGDPVYYRPAKDSTEAPASVESPVPSGGAPATEFKKSDAESPANP